jgi:hypothetical protein
MTCDHVPTVAFAEAEDVDQQILDETLFFCELYSSNVNKSIVLGCLGFVNTKNLGQTDKINTPGNCEISQKFASQG